VIGNLDPSFQTDAADAEREYAKYQSRFDQNTKIRSTPEHIGPEFEVAPGSGQHGQHTARHRDSERVES